MPPVVRVRYRQEYGFPGVFLPVNLGSGEEISMKTLAETVRTLIGFPGEIVWDTSQPNGQPRTGYVQPGAVREYQGQDA